MTQRTKIEDALGEAMSLTQALFMAAGSLADGKEMCAMQLVASKTREQILVALNALDDMREDADG